MSSKSAASRIAAATCCRPKMKVQVKKNSDQKIRNATEYGSIIAISVPTPAFGSYRATNAMIKPK